MGLLEVAIMFRDSVLSQKKFYLDVKDIVLDEEIRDQMLAAVVSLSTNAFGDEIQNFSVNNFMILFSNAKFPSLEDPERECTIRIYGIATKDTNLKALALTLEDALFQFVNRYSRIDIANKNMLKFQEFTDRFEKIFKDYIVVEKKEDPLKASKKMREHQRMREQQQYKSNSYTMDRRFG
ncbi:MAG: hypothetical protein ACTSRK_06415 [Promethearchaeota archaeon]